MKDYPNIELKWREVGLSFQVQFIKSDFTPSDNVGLNSDNVGLNSHNVGLNSDNVGLNEKLISLIKEDSQISAKELSEQLGVTSRHCERIIADLKEQGIIERQGSKKGGRWVIK